jgi:hypothetical protein
MLDVVGIVTEKSNEDDFGNTGFRLVNQSLLQFVFGLFDLVKINRHPVGPPLSDDSPVAGGVVPSEITCRTTQAQSVRACTDCRRKKNHR